MIETRHGTKGTVFAGIFFTEAAIQGASAIRHVHIEISRQNANLDQVKEKMARQAMSLGATAIMNFRYGQKKHAWYELIAFKWDTESWHGEGDAVRV